MLIYILSLLLGFLVTVVPIMNSRNTLSLGTYRVSFFHYFSAALTGLAFVIFTRSSLSPAQFSGMPPVYFVGGLIGITVILMMNFYASRLKAFHVAVLPFLGQMIMGALLDWIFGGLLDFKTLIGAVIVVAGLLIQAEAVKKPVS
ncbi:MAG: bacterial/archaeal transporter family-2 protein [Clostridiales bacterium]|nr:bacterial/archaeal transporter family-2 protein [Clostridiales bacterium]